MACHPKPWRRMVPPRGFEPLTSWSEATRSIQLSYGGNNGTNYTMYLITGNANKFKETAQFIPNLEQLDIDLTEIQSLDPKEIIKHKLQEATKVHKGEFLVEDTSFYMECLNDLPGPYIKWFEKSIGLAKIYEIAKAFNNFEAKVVITFGYMDKNKNTHYFEATRNGTIVYPRGNNGFGWDPIFVPEGHTKTHAEMSKEELKQIKLRGEAAQKVHEHLSKHK